MLEIDKTFGTIEIYCDNDKCNNYNRFEALIDNIPAMKEAMKEFRNFGWIIFNEDDYWWHYCSERCKKEDE